MVSDFIALVLDKIKDSSNKLVDSSLLSDKSWFLVKQENLSDKIVFIFRPAALLLIIKNGDVSRAKWELLSHATNSMIIEQEVNTTLFNIIFLTSDYLLLQKDGTDIYEFFVKQEKYESYNFKKEKNIDKEILADIKFFYNSKNTDASLKLTGITGQEREKEVKFIESPSQKEETKRSTQKIGTALKLKNPIQWLITDIVKNQLMTVEIMELSKLQGQLHAGDIIVKDMRTQWLLVKSNAEWEAENSERDNYLVILDTNHLGPLDIIN